MKKENIDRANELVETIEQIDLALGMFDKHGACFEAAEMHTDFAKRYKIPSCFNRDFILMLQDGKLKFEKELESL